MTLKQLNIELKTWGPLEGRYEVTITVKESRNEIQMVLPSELGDALVAQTKEFIHEFSRKAADDLHRELVLSQPVAKAIEG